MTLISLISSLTSLLESDLRAAMHETRAGASDGRAPLHRNPDVIHLLRVQPQPDWAFLGLTAFNEPGDVLLDEF